MPTRRRKATAQADEAPPAKRPRAASPPPPQRPRAASPLPSPIGARRLRHTVLASLFVAPAPEQQQAAVEEWVRADVRRRKAPKAAKPARAASDDAEKQQAKASEKPTAAPKPVTAEPAKPAAQTKKAAAAVAPAAPAPVSAPAPPPPPAPGLADGEKKAVRRNLAHDFSPPRGRAAPAKLAAAPAPVPAPVPAPAPARDPLADAVFHPRKSSTAKQVQLTQHFRTPGWESYELSLPPQSHLPPCSSGFFQLNGQVVSGSGYVGIHEYEFVAKEGFEFFVPPHNEYHVTTTDQPITIHLFKMAAGAAPKR